MGGVGTSLLPEAAGKHLPCSDTTLFASNGSAPHLHMEWNKAGYTWGSGCCYRSWSWGRGQLATWHFLSILNPSSDSSSSGTSKGREVSSTYLSHPRHLPGTPGLSQVCGLPLRAQQPLSHCFDSYASGQAMCPQAGDPSIPSLFPSSSWPCLPIS